MKRCTQCIFGHVRWWWHTPINPTMLVCSLKPLQKRTMLLCLEHVSNTYSTFMIHWMYYFEELQFNIILDE